jgi:hypothetical protein
MTGIVGCCQRKGKCSARKCKQNGRAITEDRIQNFAKIFRRQVCSDVPILVLVLKMFSTLDFVSA